MKIITFQRRTGIWWGSNPGVKPPLCVSVSHGQSVPLCWIRGGPVTGEEANGHTHLLSLLLLVAAQAYIDAECDTKQPPPLRQREKGNKHAKQGIWRERSKDWSVHEVEVYRISLIIYYLQGSTTEVGCSGNKIHPLISHDNQISGYTLWKQGTNKTYLHKEQKCK